jgi:GNAT superfamily N-acetyltransferase
VSDSSLSIFRSEKPGAYTVTWDEGGLPARFYNGYVGRMVVGVADLKTQHDRWSGWMIVEPIYVLTECQGKGVGRKLWDKCANDAKTDGAPGVQVCSLTLNEVARRFYAHTLKLPVSTDELVTVGDKKFQAERYELRL